jgi:hypothetical protein
MEAKKLKTSSMPDLKLDALLEQEVPLPPKPSLVSGALNFYTDQISSFDPNDKAAIHGAMTIHHQTLTEEAKRRRGLIEKELLTLGFIDKESPSLLRLPVGSDGLPATAPQYLCEFLAKQRAVDDTEKYPEASVQAMEEVQTFHYQDNVNAAWWELVHGIANDSSTSGSLHKGKAAR